jgi:hypothetical protein
LRWRIVVAAGEGHTMNSSRVDSRVRADPFVGYRFPPVGAEYSVVRVDQAKHGRCWSAVSRILYRLIAAFVRLAVRSGRSKDLEIIVLRR